MEYKMLLSVILKKINSKEGCKNVQLPFKKIFNVIHNKKQETIPLEVEIKKKVVKHEEVII